LKYLFYFLFRNVPDIYSDALISEGVLSRDEVSQIIGDHSDWLNEHFKQIETFKPERTNLKENWAALKEPSSSITYWDTGLPSGKTNPQKGPKVTFLSRFLRTYLKDIYITLS
jgi:2-oxoglutarate dehydrogenase complex dehydrogenase (E1) component-like enzyme